MKTNEQQRKKVLNKFTILCWATFIAILAARGLQATGWTRLKGIALYQLHSLLHYRSGVIEILCSFCEVFRASFTSAPTVTFSYYFLLGGASALQVAVWRLFFHIAAGGDAPQGPAA